jgi:tetrahydromethanopterin S-methyltransferase subunit D
MLQYILQSAMPLAKRQHRLKRVCFYMNKQQVSIAAGTDNQGRETAEFVGSLIGGFFGVLGGGGWGSAILGAIGSK